MLISWFAESITPILNWATTYLRRQSKQILSKQNRSTKLYMAAISAEPNFNENWSVEVRVREANGVLVPRDL